MSTIKNAAPMTISLGIQDNSTRAKSITREEVPTHLPKIYLYTKKGPTTPQLVGSSGRTQMFGTESFDPMYKWCNHATVFSNVMMANGNAQMIERVVPADAGPKANFCLWLDVLPVSVPLYQRNADGSYVRDATTNEPIQVTGTTTTTTGYKLKWVLKNTTTGLATDADSTLFGNKTSTPGDQTDGSTTSTRYPIFEFWASSFGSYANNAGFRLFAPTTASTTTVNQKLLSKLKAYPFRLAAVSRSSSTATPVIKNLISGDASLEFVVEEGQINPYTEAEISLGDIFESAWSSLNVEGYDNIYADLGSLHIYQSYLDTILGDLYAKEQAYIDTNAITTGTDFTVGATDGKYMVNFLSAVSSSAIPYYTVVMNTSDSNAVALTESTNLMAAGGTDGTMDNDSFAALVSDLVAGYADESSYLMDSVTYPESIIYDSGFPLATKKALAQFISVRKDTYVVLATYTVGDDDLTESEEASIGAALRSALTLYPESTYFGTPVVRGSVMARHGKLHKSVSTYKGQLPYSLELAYMASRMMGASNGQWKNTYLFDCVDNGGNNICTQFSTINVDFVPAATRNDDWDIGLNYPLPYSRSQKFYPAMKTAYSDDTSVLTSFFTAMAAVELEKIGQAAWRQFSGGVGMTDAQLCARVNSFVNDEVSGKFAGLVKVVPDCTVTSGDETRGYSWTLPIALYANNQKTVMTLSIGAYRMSDYSAS